MAEPLDTGRFDNRKEAGLKLAGRLGHLRDQNVVVLALPRGGVPVAAEVARSLDAPLDLMLVRKVGLPSQPELALGAIAGDDGGSFVMNPEVAAVSGLDAGAISNLAEAELFSNWSQIVGETNAANSHPETLVNSTLTVRCKSTAWATQLRLMQIQP